MATALKMGSVGLLLAGCNAASAEPTPTEAFRCGVALVVERQVAKRNRFESLVEDLGPVIEWYAMKSAALPEGERGEKAAFALMNRFTDDPAHRKTVGKACVRTAFQDPAFGALLLQLKGEAAGR